MHSENIILMKRILSDKAFEEAKKYIPGGISSPVRTQRMIDDSPLFINHAKGAILTDIDGNEYIDFCLSEGVFIAGHANPVVVDAVQKAILNGTSYGIPTLLETQLAKKITELIPSMQQVRFVNSGTEAVISAVRVAQGFTNREYILSFEGSCNCKSCNLLHAPFNDKEAVEKIFSEYGDRIAAVIVEPVLSHMGVVPEKDGFLQYLRSITQQYGSQLIFDEITTAFRLTLGGAQKFYGITPDLTTVGKIVGGGFPAAAFGGRADVMKVLAPEGTVYQAGTLAGNPIAMTAGLATLSILSERGLYNNLNLKAEKFIADLQSILRPKGVTISSIGNMFTPFFSSAVPTNYDEASQSNQKAFIRFWRYMLDNGVYLSPSQFEANFVSIQHTEEYLSDVLEIAKGY